ncbi:hypothetical protein Btru_044905 [Bulinus truncatus]|nr:hypothetical protein Btru_044905 [Bulinus truncatus]
MANVPVTNLLTNGNEDPFVVDHCSGEDPFGVDHCSGEDPFGVDHCSGIRTSMLFSSRILMKKVFTATALLLSAEGSNRIIMEFYFGEMLTTFIIIRMESPNIEFKKIKVSSELSEFDAVFDELVNDVTKDGLLDKEIKSAFAWFKEVLIYNVPHGKKNRGLSVVTSFKHLVPNASDEDIKIARVMGWCVELLQGFFLVADDVMDNSLTRRGQPCWYKKEGVGMIAINDSYFLESCIYKLIKCYASKKSYYVHLIELFLETTLQTVIGQCMD